MLVSRLFFSGFRGLKLGAGGFKKQVIFGVRGVAKNNFSQMSGIMFHCFVGGLAAGFDNVCSLGDRL